MYSENFESSKNAAQFIGGQIGKQFGEALCANGSKGTSGTPDVSGSLLLASNNFYREFTDDPEITEDAAELPQMGGSGLVRDLREATSLGTDEAEDLQESVEAFAAATTRQAQLGCLQ